jgi:uncharacterized ferredoxin-like protein
MKTIDTVAELMDISARTAPKTKGEDYIVTKILDQKDIQRLGDEMIKFGEKMNKPGFIRDGKNVKDSQALILIGVKNHPPLGSDCGACGFTCNTIKIGEKSGNFLGPNCIKRIIDLGIALGSAVKTASIHNIDNRIMYRAGHIARKIGLIDVNVVYAIPLSVSGKNIYFDRTQ